MKRLYQTTLGYLDVASDPLQKQMKAVKRAKRAGIAHLLEPLAWALAEADALGIEFHGQRLHDYMAVVQDMESRLDLLESHTVQVPAASVTSLPSPAQPDVMPTPAPALQPARDTELPAFVCSSATLSQAYKAMVHEPNSGKPEPERMLAVTGIAYAGLRTLDHLIEVKMTNQSTVSAAFDMEDFRRILLSLYDHGQALHAIFHTHPFAGPPTPSGIDWRLQARLDQGGYPTIQAVFSSDGYVRFFAKRPFTLTISGKGITHVDPASHLFRLVNFATLPYPGHAAKPA